MKSISTILCALCLAIFSSGCQLAPETERENFAPPAGTEAAEAQCSLAVSAMRDAMQNPEADRETLFALAREIMSGLCAEYPNNAKYLARAAQADFYAAEHGPSAEQSAAIRAEGKERLCQALAADPGLPECALARALYPEPGESFEELCRLAIGRHPDFAELYLASYFGSPASGDKKAMEELSNLIRLEPSNPANYRTRFSAHFQAGRYAEALADILKAAELGYPEGLAAMETAQTRIALGDWEALDALLKRAEEMRKAGEPCNIKPAALHAMRARAKFELGDAKGALAEAAAAKSVSGETAEIAELIAKIRAGDAAGARRGGRP